MYIVEIQRLFQRGKPLPVLSNEIADEKQLRNDALAELEVCISFNSSAPLILGISSAPTCNI